MIVKRLTLALAVAASLVGPALAGNMTVRPVNITEWKSVYGRVEARDTIFARARIGGTLIEVAVSEGDDVSTGQVLGVVRDDKLVHQIDAIDAQIKALASQHQNAEAERDRGRKLLESGVTTKQRLQTLETQVEVLRNQLAAAEAQREVLVQQGQEGAILAPADGKVLAVPITKGSVVMPGEAVFKLGGGGFFLRLAIPERHATMLKPGASLEIEMPGGLIKGQLAKIYPEISDGRVIADVEVPDLPTGFVNIRLLVRVPVGTRQVLMVPAAAITTRSGIDFIPVTGPEGIVERAIVVGEPAGDMVEILSGLSDGDTVIVP